MNGSCLSWDQSLLAVAFGNPNDEHERIKCYRVVLSPSSASATPLKKTSGGTITATNGENTSSATTIDLQLRCTLVKGSSVGASTATSPSTTAKALEEPSSGEWALHRMYFVGTSNNFLLCCYRGRHSSGSNTGTSMMLLLWDLTRGVICQRQSVMQQQQQHQVTFMDCCLSSTDNTILHILFHDKASHKYIIYEYAFTDSTSKSDGNQEQRQYLRLIRKIKAGSSRISSPTTNNEVSTDASSWQQQRITSNSTYISTLLPHKDSTHSKLQFIDAVSGKRVKFKSSSSVRSSSECCSISSMKQSNAIIVVYLTQTDNANNNINTAYAVDVCEYKKDDDGNDDDDDDATSPKKSHVRLSTKHTYEGLTSLPTCFVAISNKDHATNNNSSDNNNNNNMVVTCNDGNFFVCIDNKMEHTTVANTSTSTLLLTTGHACLPHTLVTFQVNNNTKDVSCQLYKYHHSVDDHTNAITVHLESANNGKNHSLDSATDKARGRDEVNTEVESNKYSSTSTANDNKSSNKRKATSAVIMGPGETLNVTSGSIHEIGQESKKVKKADPDESVLGDDDVDDAQESSSIWDLVCHEGTNVDTYMNSIAGRIAVLRRQMAHSDNDDSSLDGDEGDGTIAIPSAISGQTKKKPVQTSSNALTVILKQALQSSNEIQLEEAFAVTDESVVKSTIASITDDDLIWTLLMKIIHRISKKPSRAVWLGGVWLKTILEYHSSTFLKLSEEEGESLVYNALGPLANMLKERTELLPHLMRLQGRFNMISRHHGI